MEGWWHLQSEFIQSSSHSPNALRQLLPICKSFSTTSTHPDNFHQMHIFLSITLRHFCHTHYETIAPKQCWPNSLRPFWPICTSLSQLWPSNDKGNCAGTIFTLGAQITVTTCRIVQCGANWQNMLRQCSAIFTAGRSNANYHKLFSGSKSAWGHLRENCVFSQALMERSDLIVRGKAIHLGRC